MLKQINRHHFLYSLMPAFILMPSILRAGQKKKEKTKQAFEPLPEITTTHHGNLTIHCMVLGKLSVNCFFVVDQQKNCLVIDPGAEADAILGFIKRNKLSIKAWLLTHSHLDHISALDECYAALQAPVAMHPEENDWAFCEKNQWEPHYSRTEKVPVKRVLKHWDKFTDGSLQYTVLHTPGHSAGSVCFWFPEEKVVFSGDTLFAGTVGRTDLHKSSFKSLLRSLGVFLPMPPETVIYPGHGETTTVKTEVETNPFFKHTPDKKPE